MHSVQEVIKNNKMNEQRAALHMHMFLRVAREAFTFIF